MLKPENIQIINTKSPIGESQDYTINFAIQSERFSCSSARILISKDSLFKLTEGEKAQAVIDLIKESLAEDNTEH